MPFTFQDLDETTREYMAQEITLASSAGNLYFSRRFTAQGKEEWPRLLLKAALDRDEHWLAYQLETQGLMTGLENSRTPSGGYTVKHVPHTAAETIAEGQFNRYYILGLCARAVAEGIARVRVYRAKPVANARPESAALIGTGFDPSSLAAQIRPVEASLRHELLKPNSGLSVQIVSE